MGIRRPGAQVPQHQPAVQRARAGGQRSPRVRGDAGAAHADKTGRWAEAAL